MRQQGRPPRPRMQVESRETKLDRKRRLTAKRANDGRANGVVEIRGPVGPDLERVIRSDVDGAFARVSRRDPEARILLMARRGEDLVIETESEKLAQHIADTLRKSRHMEIERAYVDGAACRFLVCHPARERR